jgi:ABC-type antimicrobial peptide transport system permease subunit
MRYYRQIQAPQPFPNCCLQTHLRVAIHTNVDPVTYVPTLKAMVKELDADIPLQDIRTLQDGVARLTARDRFFALLMGLFAAIAVILGTVGIYGVMSYTVAQRRREIGIRMALGAASNQVAGSMIWQSVVMTGIGVGVGVLAALAGAGLLQSILFNVQARDPIILLSVVALFAVVGVGSAVAPALKTGRMNPAEVLRAD